MAVGVGILYDFPILYFVLLAINVCLWFIPSKSHIMWKSVTCGYSISVPDTFVMWYHSAPTHYISVLLQSYLFEKRLCPFPSITPVWVGGQMGYGPDLSWQQDCYLAFSMSASLTSAAPLYCSSRRLALLCIWAKIRFFLGKASLVKFWTSRIPIIVSSPQVWRWQPFVEITNNIMEDTMTLSAVFRPFMHSSLNQWYRLMLLCVLVHLCTLCA